MVVIMIPMVAASKFNKKSNGPCSSSQSTKGLLISQPCPTFHVLAFTTDCVSTISHVVDPLYLQLSSKYVIMDEFTDRSAK